MYSCILPRVYYNLPKVQRNINETVHSTGYLIVQRRVIIEQDKNRRNGGMATCMFRNDIPIEE